MTDPENKDNGEGMQSGKIGFRIQVSGAKYRKHNAARPFIRLRRTAGWKPSWFSKAESRKQAPKFRMRNSL